MGKDAGKTLLSLGGFFLGAGGLGQAFFGTTNSLMAGLYGMSLVSNVWSATHKPEQAENYSRFDVFMNSVDSNARIPVIYGTRKFGGLQSYHSTTSDGKTLYKDIIIAEGAIKGIYGTTANEVLVTGSDETNHVFGVKNARYSDATVTVFSGGSTGGDKVLRLYAAGKTTDIALQHPNDLADDQSNSFSCYMNKLCNYIQSIGYSNTLASEGWLVTNAAITNDAPENIKEVPVTSCYNSSVTMGIDKLASPLSTYWFFNGSSTQGAPDNYMTVGGYRNMAFLRARLVQSEGLQGGNPNITYVCQGKLVYDTRTGVTGYSENPAMCLRDYLLSRRYGCGHFIEASMIDEDAFKEAADYCDELVTYIDQNGNTVTEPRLTLNIILDTKKKHIEHLQDMMNSFGGFLVFTNNHVALRIERATEVSYAFDDDTIVEDSVQYTVQTSDQKPNQWNVTYFDPLQNWTGTKCKIENTIDQQPQPVGRGKVIPKDVVLVGCTRQSQALRQGRLFRDISLVCPMVVQFSTATMGMHLEPGDVVTMTKDIMLNGASQRLFTDLPLRILEISNSKGVWTIKGRQYNASVYNDSLGANIVAKNYAQITNPLNDNVPKLSSLSLTQQYYRQADGTIVSNIDCHLGVPSYQFLRSVIVDYSVDGGITWVNIPNYTGNTAVIHNAIVGASYIVRGKIENTTGRTSATVTTLPTVVTGKDGNPLDVSSFNSVVDVNDVSKVTLTWGVNQESDIKGYEIRLGELWNTAVPIKNNVDSLYPTIIFENKYMYTVTNSGSYSFLIKALDFSGNYSENAMSTTATTQIEPSDVSSFIAFQNGSNVNFAWTKDVTNYTYEIREGSTWTNSSLVATGITGSTYQTEVDTETIKYYHIKAVNNIGKYSVNDQGRIVNIVNLPVPNIILQFNEIELGNGTGENYKITTVPCTYENISSITNKFFYDDFTTEQWTDYETQGTLSLRLEPFLAFANPFMPMIQDEPTNGYYITQQKDLGYIISARISTRFTSNQLSYNGINVVLYFRTSLDGNVWSTWDTFSPRTVTTRFIQFKVTFSTDDKTKLPVVSVFKDSIDVPDVTRSGNAYVPIIGTFVSYGYQYYTVQNPVITALGVNVLLEITQIDNSKFYVKIKDAMTNQYIAGNVNWFVNGY